MVVHYSDVIDLLGTNCSGHYRSPPFLMVTRKDAAALMGGKTVTGPKEIRDRVPALTPPSISVSKYLSCLVAHTGMRYIVIWVSIVADPRWAPIRWIIMTNDTGDSPVAHHCFFMSFSRWSVSVCRLWSSVRCFVNDWSIIAIPTGVAHHPRS